MIWRIAVFSLLLIALALLGMLLAALKGPLALSSGAALGVWAIVGPLLSAAASAIWQRRVAREDRDHAQKIAKEARNHAEQIELQKYERNRRFDLQKAARERLELERATILSGTSAFIRAASVYQYAATNSITAGLRRPDSREKLIVAYEEFAAAYSAAALLSDGAFESLCTELWIATNGLNFDLANIPADNATRQARFRHAQGALTAAARELAASLRGRANDAESDGASDHQKM